MSSPVTFSIDASGFNRMATEVAKITGLSFRQVLRSGAGKILAGAVRHTKVAKTSEIRKAQTRRLQGKKVTTAGGYVTTNKQNSAGREWLIINNKKYIMKGPYAEKRYYASKVAEYETARQIKTKEIREKLKNLILARGLAKQSWKLLADALGVPINVPAYVGKARARDASGKTFIPRQNANVMESGRRNFTITLTNSSPAVDNPSAGGRAAIQRAISGQAKYLEISLEKATVDELRKRILPSDATVTN